MGTSEEQNNGQRFHDSDDALNNAKSFEEAKDIIKTRLKFLRVDIDSKAPIEESMINELNKAHDDRKRKLMDIYARYFSPCKVGDYGFDPKTQRDMNDIMIDFSEGYDKFIRSMEEDLVGMLMRRRRATLLLTKLLSIKYPYSKVMYLYYYKNMKENEISQKFFMSRATFYRIKNIGVEMLTRMYYPSKPGTSAK